MYVYYFYYFYCCGYISLITFHFPVTIIYYNILFLFCLIYFSLLITLVIMPYYFFI